MKNKIFQEEIERQSKEFNVSESKIKNFLTELFTFNSSTLLKNLGSQEEILNDNDSLPNEFWEEIINNRQYFLSKKSKLTYRLTPIL